MARKSKHLSYEELRDKWYKKLKKQGFEDIEDINGQLKMYSSTLLGNRKKVLVQHGGWQAKAEYYNLAGQFLNEYKFNTKLDKIIWEYHANGLGVREIAQILRKVRVLKTSHTTIWNIIKRLKIIMYSMYLEPKKEYRE